MKIILLLLFALCTSKVQYIPSGTTYFMYPGINRNQALMPRDSRPGWENVVIFDKTTRNSEKWLLTDEGGFWRVKNAGTELSLHYRENVRDANVDQNFYDGSDYYKWIIEEVSENVIMLKAFRKDDRGDEFYMTADRGDRGTEIFLRRKSNINAESQRWYLERTEGVQSNEFTRTRANEIGRDYLNKYWVPVRQSDGSYVKSLGGKYIKLSLYAYRNVLACCTFILGVTPVTPNI